MKTPAKMIPHSVRANITSWLLEHLDQLPKDIERAVLNAATEAINLALKDDAEVWFRIEYTFDPIDPMTICVGLPLGENDSDNPVWSFSLSDVVNNAIEMAQSPDGQISDDERGALLKIRDGLRALVDKIDAATTSKPRTRGPNADGN